MLPSESPFRAFPNSEEKGSATPHGNVFRARVTHVHKNTAGQFLFLFRVTPLTGGVTTGARDNEIDNVVLLHPGFGSLDSITPPPSGMIFVPQVGSVVLVMWDGHQWCIVGYYSGPVKTNSETGPDPESRVVSYNPGIETATSRLQGLPGWDVPHWAFGVQEGDCIMGRGQARVKATGQGVVVGSDLDAFRIYTSDGKIIERFGRREVRGVGYWQLQRYRKSNQEAIRNKNEIPQESITPPDAACYHAEIVEVAPTPSAQKPYVLEQKGYVSRKMINDGRSAMVTDVTSQTVVEELASRDYVVHRLGVVQPLQHFDPKLPGDELDRVAYEVFDKQVDADGSFRLRAGNLGALPGSQSTTSTQQMDLSVDYDARSNELVIRIGRAGAEATEIKLRGDDPASAVLEVLTSKLRAVVRDSATLEAKKATVKASQITLDGNVRVTGSITCDKQITAQEVTASGIKLTKHRHTHGGSAGITSSPQP